MRPDKNRLAKPFSNSWPTETMWNYVFIVQFDSKRYLLTYTIYLILVFICLISDEVDIFSYGSEFFVFLFCKSGSNVFSIFILVCPFYLLILQSFYSPDINLSSIIISCKYHLSILGLSFYSHYCFWWQ